MKIKFQADNDLDEDILRAMKRLQPAIDFSAHRNLIYTWAFLMRKSYAYVPKKIAS